MKWTYHIEKKFKMALALAVVFALVLLTNMINKNHFAKLQASFGSVYEDRLLVENYIFKLSGILNKRQLILYDTTRIESKSEYIKRSNDAIDTLIHDYQKTEFTALEIRLFEEFKVELEKLQNLESSYYKDVTMDSQSVIVDKHQTLTALLMGLSDIQMKEGKNLINQSNNVISTNNLFSQIEIVILIMIGLVVQILVLSSKPISSKFPQNERLN